VEVGDRARVHWRPYLRLPGLRRGESVKRRVFRHPHRAAILAADGRRLDRISGTAGIVGTAPGGDSPGSGLERRYDARLGGRPGAELRYGHRLIRRVKVRRGHTVHATISPRLQRVAQQALGNRLGGVAVLRPRDGSVLALSGLAVSGPQPPGSTFKIITLSASLQNGIAKPTSTYPVRTAARLSGVLLRNASNESCGGTLVNAFAVSCNSVFAPLGAKLGARRLLAAAERFGFNERLRIPAFRPSTIARKDLTDDLAVGAAAIGQNRDLATPLEMASVGATIGNRGIRARPRIVRSEKVHRRRAVSASVAAQVRTMMLGVVSGGTGTAASLPGVEVAGKTGTAELRSTVGGPPDPKNTDAWFVAFAPASHPTVAVGVMLVGAGAGGAAAAPLAREVLAAAL
jgi:cell division protein FtsI/penicillin-binding protein 2